MTLLFTFDNDIFIPPHVAHASAICCILSNLTMVLRDTVDLILVQS